MKSYRYYQLVYAFILTFAIPPAYPQSLALAQYTNQAKQISVLAYQTGMNALQTHKKMLINGVCGFLIWSTLCMGYYIYRIYFPKVPQINSPELHQVPSPVIIYDPYSYLDNNYNFLKEHIEKQRISFNNAKKSLDSYCKKSSQEPSKNQLQAQLYSQLTTSNSSSNNQEILSNINQQIAPTAPIVSTNTIDSLEPQNCTTDTITIDRAQEKEKKIGNIRTLCSTINETITDQTSFGNRDATTMYNNGRTLFINACKNKAHSTNIEIDSLYFFLRVMALDSLSNKKQQDSQELLNYLLQNISNPFSYYIYIDSQNSVLKQHLNNFYTNLSKQASGFSQLPRSWCYSKRCQSSCPYISDQYLCFGLLDTNSAFFMAIYHNENTKWCNYTNPLSLEYQARITDAITSYIHEFSHRDNSHGPDTLQSDEIEKLKKDFSIPHLYQFTTFSEFIKSYGFAAQVRQLHYFLADIEEIFAFSPESKNKNPQLVSLEKTLVNLIHEIQSNYPDWQHRTGTEIIFDLEELLQAPEI